jgi:hypothetical protein
MLAKETYYWRKRDLLFGDSRHVDWCEDLSVARISLSLLPSLSRSSLTHVQRDALCTQRITEYSLALEDERQTSRSLEQQMQHLKQQMQDLHLKLNNLQVHKP